MRNGQRATSGVAMNCEFELTGKRGRKGLPRHKCRNCPNVIDSAGESCTLRAMCRSGLPEPVRLPALDVPRTDAEQLECMIVCSTCQDFIGFDSSCKRRGCQSTRVELYQSMLRIGHCPLREPKW